MFVLTQTYFQYLRDVKDLEGAKLLSAGSYVSADNVVFNRLDEYREHMRKLKLQGVVESRLEEMNLEYSNNLKDGIGECCVSLIYISVG